MENTTEAHGTALTLVNSFQWGEGVAIACLGSHARDDQDSMMDELARVLFGGAIDALMSDELPEQRLAEATAFLNRLTARDEGVPGQFLHELKDIVEYFARMLHHHGDPSGRLPEDCERRLTTALFSLYMDVSRGVLVF